MADFYIRICKKIYGEYNNPIIIDQFILKNKENKKQTITYLLENYPEYFDKKVCQKTSKDEFFYVNIYELDAYWSNYWNKTIKCKNCGKERKLIEVLQYKSNYDFCCNECKETWEKEHGTDIFEITSKYYYIYKITNKNNNKCYIGKSIRHPLWRWWEHLKSKSNDKFHDELKKTELEDWQFEVIKRFKKESMTHDELLEVETKYINQFNSINDGYNSMISKHGEENYDNRFDF